MASPLPHETFLKDYKPSDYLIEHAFLHFDLQPNHTIVKSVLKIKKNPEGYATNNDLCLHGGDTLELKMVLLDGKALATTDYKVSKAKLTIPHVPDAFSLELEVIIKPAENKALSGLYQSKGNYCTQCEAQGFRRITYFLDRPDVLTRFTTTITADKSRYPVLLSNGNLIGSKNLDEKRHWVMWEDPSLKPAYLFALVAGDYESLTDNFITCHGRDVVLKLYVEKGNISQSQYAMESLKRAMRWDEETYGREYDLDIYMIVAVSDFNMGAMENKGLNIFNDRYILAKPDTATDDDYVAIESVIGHEYFHNWSGNRVTVRDWFQITLKEGLTIFRDQNFTADMTSPAVKRIKDVSTLRQYQFPQDAGPMAHPIRPESYIEINNFYTVTVYNKGAEVIRMIETILGKSLFNKGLTWYFDHNDGKAVTTEDFVKAMEHVSQEDLQQFRNWYRQAGTPEVAVASDYDAKNQTYMLTFTQTCPPTPNQPYKEDFHIPIRLALLDQQGKEMPLMLGEETNSNALTERVFSLKKKQEKIIFKHIKEKPCPSLLRHFSAPVKLFYPYHDDELIFLMSHDTDCFNSWDAAQQLASKLMIQMVKDYATQIKPKLEKYIIEAFRTILNNEKLDKLFIAEMMVLPSESYLHQLMPQSDIVIIHNVRQFVRTQLSQALQQDFLRHYHANDEPTFNAAATSIAKRKIKNLCLSYLLLSETAEMRQLAMQQFQAADNITDRVAVLSSLTHIDCPERQEAFDQFYKLAEKEPLVIDKWFSLQAISSLPDTFEKVKKLMSHPQFQLENPNKTRSLLGIFAQHNLLRFHDISGKPYTFLVDQVRKIDTFNPQLAARLIEPLIQWRKYDPTRQQLMRQELERLKEVPNLSNDVYELVIKSLA